MSISVLVSVYNSLQGRGEALQKIIHADSDFTQDADLTTGPQWSPTESNVEDDLSRTRDRKDPGEGLKPTAESNRSLHREAKNL